MLDAAPDAVVAVQSDGTIVYANVQAGELFGYGDDKLIGQPVEILVPARFSDVHTAHRARYFGSPVTRPMGEDLDLYARRRDGSEFPAEISLSAIDTDEGRLATASIRDITARRAAESKFEQLLEAAPDAMVIVDQKGYIALVNAQVERLFGYHRAELLGHPVEVLMPERFREHHEGFRDAFMQRPTVRPMGAELELFGLHKHGHEFPVEISLSPLQTEGGRVVSAAIRDVSERRRAEAALSEARAELERRELARRQAVDINDNIIQGLSVALYEARDGNLPFVEEALAATLVEARRIVDDLQGNGIEPGDLRRRGGVPVLRQGPES
jgi:PAS domain S-box-containing protein